MAKANHGADLLKEARRLSGLSQRGLAEKAGTVQSVVARIELGLASPSVETLVRLLAAAGFELAPRLAPKPSISQADLAESARLRHQATEARLDVPRLEVQKVVAALHWHRVRYVLGGVLAARLQGMPRTSSRMEIVPAHDLANLKALASALRELDPRIHSEAIPEGLSFDCSATTLGRADSWDLETGAGRVAVVFKTPGLKTYEDVARGAKRMEMFGASVEVAGLADVTQAVAALGRPEDRQDLFLLEHLLSEGESMAP